MNKKHFWSFSFFILFLVLIFVLPFTFIFGKSVLSHNINDWGAFGSYFSLAISAANLIVFVYLTILVSRIDNERHENEIKSQYRITITQFRQTEINTLTNRLNSIFENFEGDPKQKVLDNLTVNAIFLNNFFNEKSYLFPILKTKKLRIINKNFQDKCTQLMSIIDENYGSELSELHMKKLSTKIEVMFTLRNQLIEELQKFMLDELNSKEL